MFFFFVTYLFDMVIRFPTLSPLKHSPRKSKNIATIKNTKPNAAEILNNIVIRLYIYWKI